MDDAKPARLKAVTNEDALDKFLGVKDKVERIPSMLDFKQHTGLNAQGLANRLGGSWLNVVFEAGRRSASHEGVTPTTGSSIENPVDLFDSLLGATDDQIAFLATVCAVAGNNARVADIGAVVTKARARRQELIQQLGGMVAGKPAQEDRPDDRPWGPIGDPESESQ
jgi:hypothetical protein